MFFRIYTNGHRNSKWKLNKFCRALPRFLKETVPLPAMLSTPSTSVLLSRTPLSIFYHKTVGTKMFVAKKSFRLDKNGVCPTSIRALITKIDQHIHTHYSVNHCLFNISFRRTQFHKQKQKWTTSNQFVNKIKCWVVEAIAFTGRNKTSTNNKKSRHWVVSNRGFTDEENEFTTTKFITKENFTILILVKHLQWQQNRIALNSQMKS